jgi:hypothetical protein
MALYNELCLLCPGETLLPNPGAWTKYKTGTPLPQTVGVPFNVEIIAIDADTGLEDPTLTDVVYIDFSGDEAYASAPAPAPLVAGRLTVSIQLNRGGESTWVYARDQTNPDTDNSGSSEWTEVHVNIGTFSKLQLLLPGETADDGTVSGIKGTLPGALVPGIAFEVTVRAVDAHWNLMSTIADVVHVTLNNYGVVGADVNLVAGVGRLSVKPVMATMAYAATASDVTDPAKTPHTRTFNTAVPIPVGALGFLTGKPGAALSITFLDRTTGATLGVVGTPAPVYNCIVAKSGHLFMDNSDLARVMSPNYVLLGGAAPPPPFMQMTTGPTASADTFYRTLWEFHYNSGSSGPGHYVSIIQEVDKNGVGGRVWTMPPWNVDAPSGGDPDSPYDCLVRSMAVSPDNKVLYWNGSNRNGQANEPTGWAIQRFDLVAGTPMSDLPCSPSSYPSIFGLADGNILAYEGYYQGQVLIPWQMRIYSPSGAIVRTIMTGNSLGATYGGFCWDIYDSHIWLFEMVNMSLSDVIHRMDLTTGAFTHTITAPQAFQTPCPMYVVRVQIGKAYVPPTPPTSPPSVLVNSDPCCCGDSGGGVSSPNAGNVLPSVGPAWTPTCAGYGVVPVADHIPLAEAWDY